MFSYNIDLYDKMIQTTFPFAEVSDQNFVDEEVDEGEKESQMCNAKSMKSFITDASSNDQVMHLITELFYYHAQIMKILCMLAVKFNHLINALTLTLIIMCG